MSRYGQGESMLAERGVGREEKADRSRKRIAGGQRGTWVSSRRRKAEESKKRGGGGQRGRGTSRNEHGEDN